MTDAKKNGAPERIWIEDERPYGGMCHLHSEGTLGQIIYGVEYVRADLLADMARQRDELAAKVALAKEALGWIILMDRRHGLTPDSRGRQVWYNGRNAAVAQAALDAINTSTEDTSPRNSIG